MTNKQALREELSNPEIGNKDHLRKIALALLDELEAVEKRIAEMKELLQWSHDTLLEINPSDYTHDDVCEANAAAVEVILGIAPTLGETHGKTNEWWESRAAGIRINGEG